MWDRLQEASAYVQSRASVRPQIAVVLGSGLGALADDIKNGATVPYAEIPHFPRSTAPGHAGKLVVGSLEGQPVIAFSGRAHLYEGYSADDVVFGVRLARQLGARALIVTNAAGGVRASFLPGTLMLISDHINLTGANPLCGPNESRLGSRFPDMSDAYDGAWRESVREIARQQQLVIPEGVYLGLMGPNYETPAEIRMARLLGADAVGMSTVLEVIAAHHAGMRVLGISCITNLAAGMLPQKLSEAEVIETADRVRATFTGLIRRIVAEYRPISEEMT